MRTEEENKVYIQDWEELPYFDKEQNLTLKNKFKEINVFQFLIFNFRFLIKTFVW